MKVTKNEEQIARYKNLNVFSRPILQLRKHPGTIFRLDAPGLVLSCRRF